MTGKMNVKGDKGERICGCTEISNWQVNTLYEIGHHCLHYKLKFLW